MTHTPGPWKTISIGYDNDTILKIPVEGGTRMYGVAHGRGNPHSHVFYTLADLIDNEADANLIAAAPDMLEALTAATMYLAQRVENPDRGVTGRTIVLPLMRSAIAKATAAPAAKDQ